MGGEMDARYATTDGRKVVYSSLNPVKLLKNANVYTYVALILIVLLVAAIVLITRSIVLRRKKKKAAQA
jgi:hypothetical protein